VSAGTLWARVFGALMVAIIPPILLLAAALIFGDILTALGPLTSAVLIVFGAVAWAVVLSVVFARALDDELRNLVALAERGRGLSDDLLPVQVQLTRVIEDRNRQVRDLAARISEIPIDDEPRRVISSVVAAVRAVTGDATWRCAVLSDADTELLPRGSYASADDAAPEPIADLEQWVSGAIGMGFVERADGPWGRFLLVNISVSDRTRAVLYAPWEGRPDPSDADQALLTLVGQHAAIAIQHALLYSTVRRQADELDRLAGVQRDFLRGVTHDLQTPLTSIGGLAAELRADASLPSNLSADLDTIVYQAERLRRMVAQLLVASRVEAGSVHPQSEVFAAQPVVERTWRALRADRPFKLVVVDREPHLVVADEDRLEQVLWAVLDNAVKYSPAGAAISVSIVSRDGELSITVDDAGGGMDRSALSHAFDQFYRAPSARAMAPNGSGIGLYAARGLMRAMGGEIHITSTLGRGTSVELTLPAEHVGEE
jgi:signal transduction histidine kinase